MQNENAVVHFELPVDDVPRAQNFYSTIFGWTFNVFEMPTDGSTGGAPYYGVITTPMDDKHQPTMPGAINGGMMKRVDPAQPFMNYINVASIDATLSAVTKHGGSICMPKTEIAPGMGWIACFKDTEGNMMGLHQMPERIRKG